MSKIVTFEQAKRLKQLGYEYDIHQVYFIHSNSKDITRQVVGVEEIFLDEFKDDYSPIPTIASALDWIREEKGIECGVYPVAKELKDRASPIGIFYEYCFIDYNRCPTLEINNLYSCIAIYPTHPLSESALLDAVLTYLEERTDV